MEKLYGGPPGGGMTGEIVGVDEAQHFNVRDHIKTYDKPQGGEGGLDSAVPAGPRPVMKVRVEHPPMFDAINAEFRVVGKPILFAWGDTLYNPAGIVISQPLLEHEAFHGWRQLDMGVENWWEMYLVNPAFRLEEEILAHAVEYRSVLAAKGNNRKARRGALIQIAKKLSAPLYGRLITEKAARRVLSEAAAILEATDAPNR